VLGCLIRTRSGATAGGEGAREIADAYGDGKKGKIPRFRSDQEERDFWARHSVEEFAGELEDLDVTIRPSRTEQIAVRLYAEDLQTLRFLAAQRGVGHTTLARSVLEGWLAHSRGKDRAVPGPGTVEIMVQDGSE
jgi:predicted DNA binding CopG/RHH family protein